MSLMDKLPHRCRLQRRANVSDGMLGRRISRTVLRSNVECWEQPASVVENRQFDKDGLKVSSKIYFKTDPELQDNDEIVVTHRIVRGVVTAIPEADQRIIQVLKSSHPDASAGLGALYRVLGNFLSGS